MKQLFISLIMLGFFCGCNKKKGDEVELQKQADDYKVEFLFEVDGVSVYRFYDDKWVYFTNTSGKVEYKYTTTRTYRTGKTTHTQTSTHQCEMLCNKDTLQ